VRQVVWHRQGDYMAVVTDGATAATTVVIHRLSKRQSQVCYCVCCCQEMVVIPDWDKKPSSH